MEPTHYRLDYLLRAVDILESNPDTEFFVFRNPACTIPPLRQLNAIHRVNDAVPAGRLFLVDRTDLDYRRCPYPCPDGWACPMDHGVEP